MALQPASGYQWANISGTAAGSAQLFTGRSGILKSVVILDGGEGTATFYDSASGTNSVSFAVANDSTSLPASLDMDIRLKNGLFYVTGGTTKLLAIYN